MNISSEAFDIKALAHLFRFFSPHVQQCTLSLVSRRFRRAVNVLSLPNYIRTRIPATLLSSDVFKKFPLNYARLSHSLESALIPVFELISEPWELAAFGGNYPALESLLGDTLLTKRNETGAGVLLLMAIGGQIELIDTLTKHDRGLLRSVDLAQRNMAFYFCYCAHISGVAWLHKNTDPQLENLDEFGFHYLDCFKSTTLPRHTLLKVAFLISNEFDQVTSIPSLSTEHQDAIIEATRSYIECKDRAPEALLNIQGLITSAQKIESESHPLNY